ncbi:hypothetical protein [Amycolatopsis taiwanensis]|uniref:hypothetical protein n=1 Tax=Amycolatopsis taiwanensis TaxID=342230 RepID=UPI0004ACA4F3|nr:hypothetical protein [Amycolatopsis taiwanensis]
MPSHTDRGRLALELSRAVAGEVRFAEGSRALYANDASTSRFPTTRWVSPTR